MAKGDQLIKMSAVVDSLRLCIEKGDFEGLSKRLEGMLESYSDPVAWVVHLRVTFPFRAHIPNWDIVCDKVERAMRTKHPEIQVDLVLAGLL